MIEKTGGPAFPINIDSEMTCLGMTLRDYFASKAMQGLIERGFTEFGNKASSYANLAYEYADEMLKAREQ